MRKFASVFLFFLSLSLTFFLSLAQDRGTWEPENVPNPRANNGGWVSDPDSFLKRDTKNKINDILDAVEESSEYEVGIAIVNQMASSSPDIESFTKAVFDNWGIGKRGLNNGVLFLMSVQDRKMRLQTGAGSKLSLTDKRCKTIIESIVELLRAEDYDAAVLKVANDVNFYLTNKWLGMFDRFTWFLSRVFIVLFICLFTYAVYKSWKESKRRKLFEERLNRLKASDQIMPRVADGEACGICLEELKSQSMIKMAACNHIFHETCIVEWLEKKNTCPFCRQPDPLTPKSEQPQQPAQEPRPRAPPSPSASSSSSASPSSTSSFSSSSCSSSSCSPSSSSTTTAVANDAFADNVLDANMFIFRDVSHFYTFTRNRGGIAWTRVPKSSRSSRSFGGGHSSGGGGHSGSW